MRAKDIYINKNHQSTHKNLSSLACVYMESYKDGATVKGISHNKSERMNINFEIISAPINSSRGSAFAPFVVVSLYSVALYIGDINVFTRKASRGAHTILHCLSEDLLQILSFELSVHKAFGSLLLAR